jgi:hypothetical protein
MSNKNNSINEVIREYSKNPNIHILQNFYHLLTDDKKNILMLFLERKKPVAEDDLWFLLKNIPLNQTDSFQQNTLNYFLRYYNPVHHKFTKEQIDYLFQNTNIQHNSLSNAFLGYRENELILTKNQWELLLNPFSIKSQLFATKALYQFLKVKNISNFETSWMDILFEQADLTSLDKSNRSLFDVAVYYRKNLSLPYWKKLLKHHDFNKVIHHEYNTLLLSLKSKKIMRLPPEIIDTIIFNTSYEMKEKYFLNKLHFPKNPIFLGIEHNSSLDILQKLFQAGFKIANAKETTLESIFIKLAQKLPIIQSDSIEKFHLLFSHIDSKKIESIIQTIENSHKKTENMLKIKPIYLSYLIQQNLKSKPNSSIKSNKI